jgi:NADH-quinone oxidoreductase subunit C
MPDDATPEAAPPAPEQEKPAPVPTPPAAKPPAPPAAPKPPAPKVPAVMAATPWEDELSAAIKEQFGDGVAELSVYVGQKFIVTRPGSIVALMAWLRDEKAFDYLVDLTAVHWPEKPEPFEVIYILYSFDRDDRVRIKVRANAGEAVPSVVSVHPTADWLEREVFDMFGVEFSGHPDLKRILMPDEWSGFPLRKDYPILKMDERWVKENLGIESGQ